MKLGCNQLQEHMSHFSLEETNNSERASVTEPNIEVQHFQVNNGVVYLDYEDSHHHGPLLCSFQLLYRICLYCLMMYWFVFPFVGVPAWRLM